MKDQIQFETNGLTVLAHRVPDNSYSHRIVWSDTDDRFSIDYHFSANHRGGFILWYKDFGGRKKYPKQGQVWIAGVTTDMDNDDCLTLLVFLGISKDSLFSSVHKSHQDYLWHILRSHGIDPNEKRVLLIKEI